MDDENDKDFIPAARAGELRKAHEAIALVPRNGRLTLLDRRLINVLLKLAQEQGDLPLYRAKFSKVLSGARFESNNTEVIKEHLRKLAATTVEWSSIVPGARRWGISTLISEAEISEEGGELLLEWAYPPKIKSRLLSPELFARFSLEIAGSLRSAQGAALYEMCVQFAGIGLTSARPWQWWRPRIIGSSDDGEGVEYKYFKRDVLLPSISEINNVTDLKIELLERKLGRRVEEIQFRVERPQKKRLLLADANIIDCDILDRMVKIGVSKEEAAKLYQKHDQCKLKSTVTWVEQRLKASSKERIRSPVALLKDALTKGYVGSESTAVAIKEIACVGSPNAEPTYPQTGVQSKLEGALSPQQLILDRFDNLPDEQQAALVNSCIMESASYIAALGLKNPKGKMFRISLAKWLADREMQVVL